MVVFTIDELMNDQDDYKVEVAQTDAGENRYSTGALEHALSVGMDVAVVVERSDFRQEDEWWVNMLNRSDGLILMGPSPDEAWSTFHRVLGLDWPSNSRGEPAHFNEARLMLQDRGFVLGCTAKRLTASGHLDLLEDLVN